jgi:hypothetical protein
MRGLTYAGLAVGFALAGCGSGTPSADQSMLALSYRPIGSDIFATVIPRSAKPADIDRAARAQCGGKAWCQVIGWVDADLEATAMPMTNREAAAVAYDLSINRSSGRDRSLFDCRVFTGLPRDRCAAEVTMTEPEAS